MPVDSLDGSDPPERLIFMTMPAVLGPNEQSFEELRTADYLKAYVATGKPPPPCPALPTGDRARTALGLPPLFKPHIEVGPTAGAVAGPDSPSGTRSGGGRAQIILDAGNLPDVQIFRTTRMGAAGAIEVHQSLASQTEFVNFSHEELRCNAYAKGTIYPPTPLPLDQSPASARSTVVPHTTSPTLPNPSEDMQSLSAATPYLQHSVEELRLAFLQSGRELTSAEIFQFKPPVPADAAALPPARSSLLASTSGHAFSQPPPVQPF